MRFIADSSAIILLACVCRLCSTASIYVDTYKDNDNGNPPPPAPPPVSSSSSLTDTTVGQSKSAKKLNSVPVQTIITVNASLNSQSRPPASTDSGVDKSKHPKAEDKKKSSTIEESKGGADEEEGFKRKYDSSSREDDAASGGGTMNEDFEVKEKKPTPPRGGKLEKLKQIQSTSIGLSGVSSVSLKTWNVSVSNAQSKPPSIVEKESKQKMPVSVLSQPSQNVNSQSFKQPSVSSSGTTKDIKDSQQEKKPSRGNREDWREGQDDDDSDDHNNNSNDDNGKYQKDSPEFTNYNRKKKPTKSHSHLPKYDTHSLNANRRPAPLLEKYSSHKGKLQLSDLVKVKNNSLHQEKTQPKLSSDQKSQVSSPSAESKKEYKNDEKESTNDPKHEASEKPSRGENVEKKDDDQEKEAASSHSNAWKRNAKKEKEEEGDDDDKDNDDHKDDDDDEDDKDDDDDEDDKDDDDDDGDEFDKEFEAIKKNVNEAVFLALDQAYSKSSHSDYDKVRAHADRGDMYDHHSSMPTVMSHQSSKQSEKKEDARKGKKCRIVKKKQVMQHRENKNSEKDIETPDDQHGEDYRELDK